MSILEIPQDEDVRERVVLLCIGIAIAMMVLTTAVSGWRVNSKLEKAREARVERLEKRAGKLEEK